MSFIENSGCYKIQGDFSQKELIIIDKYMLGRTMFNNMTFGVVAYFKIDRFGNV